MKATRNPRVCDHDGCDQPVTISNRVLCPPHFQRWLAGLPADAPTADMRSIPLARRFWARVNKTPTCWLWTGPLVNGYGRIKHRGQGLTAYRVAYVLTYGAVPEGMQVDHMCHNRACVRPDHLQAVTMRENLQNRTTRIDSKTGIRGVQRRGNKWIARANDPATGERIHAGTFGTAEEAELAAIALRNRLMTNNLQDRRTA